MKAIKIIFRIIASPFWFILFFTAAIKQVIVQMIYFFKYGGEMISYWKKDQDKMIANIYEKLEQLIEEENK